MSASLPEDDGRTKELIAGADDGGRLDAWLAKSIEGDFSRSRLKALIEEGCVSIDGVAVTVPNHRLKPGQVVRVTLPEPEDPEPKGENIPLDILYEDADLIVLVKPAGLVVHPAAGNWSGTLVNALIHHCGDSLSGIGGVKRPGIVHRLDKDTSGVMVVAKTDRAHRHLSEQFADHGRSGPLERAYLAFVWGVPHPRQGTINAAIGRAADRIRRSVKRDGAEDARHAVTHYSVTRTFIDRPKDGPLVALVECRLETGRTHQIRVHMAHIGHPLLGDADYGGGFKTKANLLPEAARQKTLGLGRQALHAFLLAFEHPVTKKTMRFEAPMPADLAALATALDTPAAD